MLVVVDEYTSECLAIDVARRLRGDNVLYRLSKLFARRGTPGYIRSDNAWSSRPTLFEIGSSESR